jgi:vacuolar-type H+-ATPase subunit I/STV1
MEAERRGKGQLTSRLRRGETLTARRNLSSSSSRAALVRAMEEEEEEKGKEKRKAKSCALFSPLSLLFYA